MLISRFHRMIRNRMVWAIFAIASSLALLGFIGPSYSCRRSRLEPSVDAEGRLFGHEVASRDFYLARYFELGMNERNAPDTLEGNQALRRRTWKRLAALEAAKKMGLHATDVEVGQVIRRDPSFAVNGVFDAARYCAVVQNQLRVGVETFETYVRESLTLRKLLDVFRAVVWIPLSELEERLKYLTDNIVVEYVTLKPDDELDRADVSRSDAEAFFATNQALFAVPAKMTIRYVAIPVSNYVESVTVSDSEVADYYDSHLEEFSITNGVGTNASVQAVPLVDVRDAIRSNLIWQGATLKARDAAVDLAVALTPDRDGRLADFNATAEAAGYVVQTSGWFTESEAVPGIDAGLECVRAAFSLDSADPDRAYSDPIVGSNYVYIIVPGDRIEARIPEFEEVAERVMSVLRERARRRAFLTRAQEIREKIASSVSGGKTFCEAAHDFGLNVATTASFSVYESVSTNTAPEITALIPSLLWMEKHDISEPVEYDEAAVIGHVAERTPGDAATLQMLAPELRNTLQNYRAGIVFDEWCDYVLAQANFLDHRPLKALEAETQAEEEEEDTGPRSQTPRPTNPIGAGHLNDLL